MPEDLMADVDAYTKRQGLSRGAFLAKALLEAITTQASTSDKSSFGVLSWNPSCPM